MSKILRRLMPTEVRVLDAKAGVAEYVASDETLDSYREVIRAKGWRFTHFAKNSPFVDSHNYDSVDRLLGSVVDFKVDGGRLVETVQWAVEVPENTLAQLGWKMTEAGYLKAVSVGFQPVRAVSKWSQGEERNEWLAELESLGMKEDQVRAIYLEQEQVELSAVIIGANPNALARAYKAGVIEDGEMERICREIEARENTGRADGAAAALQVRLQARARFLERFEAAVKAS
jgi:hypothetical protein